jgi:hypothetical protein
METGFLQNQSLFVLAPVMVSLLILATVIGFRSGKTRRKKESVTERLEKTAGTIAGAMLALLGFILAVSLSMADSHFETRRKLVLEEANAIGTARLRASAVGGENGTEIARLLLEYAQTRVDFFIAGKDAGKLRSVYRRTSDLQQRIWNLATAIAGSSPTPISAMLLSSLNEVFDLGTTRRWAFEVRVPAYIVSLLFLFAVLSMGMMGYYFGVCGVSHPVLSTILIIAFAIALLLVIDLNRPRSGLILPEQTPLYWLLEDTHS